MTSRFPSAPSLLSLFPPRPPPPEESAMDDLLATTEKKALVEIVKLVQKRGWKGTKGDWKEFLNVHNRKLGARLSDPARRPNSDLIAFLKTFDQEDHLQFMAKVMQSCSKRNMVQQFTSSLDDESPEQRLVRLTLQHPLYPLEYSFLSTGQDWIVTKVGKKSKVMRSDRILAIDCEMVLCVDGTEALVRVCVVDHNLQVKLDEMVHPDKAVEDYRTEITGITAADLEGVTCSLADVQKSLKKLLSKGSILVGHSLSNDLNVLKIDHTWVIDTSFIFKYSNGLINRRPSLSNLCKTLLGYELRKKDAPHNCLDDACAAMKLVIARLENRIEDSVPLPEMDVREIDTSKLFLHKIPLYVPSEELQKIMPGDFTIELKPSWKTRGNKYSAYAIFKNSEEAQQAYENINGSEEKDSFGRPQKLITLRLSKCKPCSMYIRKMTDGDGIEGDASRKRAYQVEETSNISKKLKTDENIKEETMEDENGCHDDLEEIAMSKKELKVKDLEAARPNGKVSKHRKKDKKWKKKRH